MLMHHATTSRLPHNALLFPSTISLPVQSCCLFISFSSLNNYGFLKNWIIASRPSWDLGLHVYEPRWSSNRTGIDAGMNWMNHCGMSKSIPNIHAFMSMQCNTLQIIAAMLPMQHECNVATS